MKRIFSILLALALVLGFSLMSTTPVGAATINVPGDYSTIQAAINAASPGDTIEVAAGTYFGATVNKTVTIQAKAGDTVIINDGPNTHSFLRAGFYFAGDYSGNGAAISGFRFAGTNQMGYTDDGKLDFAIFSRGADHVTVENNVITDMLQAITANNGEGWQIRGNQITDLWTLNGGGIGILVGTNNGGTVQDSTVSDNQISGTLSVYSGDGGGYDGSGIVLYADFRYANTGGIITSSLISGNDISMVSDTPGVVSFNGIELTDTRDSDGNPASVYGSQVTQNDVHGNSRNGVLVSGGTSDNHINLNNIHGNLVSGVSYSGTGTLDATSNWWGANDGPGPVGPGSGDKVSANVDYSSWVQQTSTATGTGTASFGPSAGTITGITGVSESSLPPVAQATKPISFPNGLFSFNITGLSNGQAVNVTITLPPGSAPTQYWKYHVNEGGWVQIPMTIVGPPNVIVITLVDGGLGDDDGLANGVIVDQGGPGGGSVGWETYPVSKARVLLPWISLLAVILAGTSLVAVRRRRAQS